MRIRHTFLIGVFAVAAFAVGGCGTARHGGVHDTAAVHDTVAVHDTLRDSRTVTIHDTTIGVAGAELVTDTVHDTVERVRNLQLTVYHGRVTCKEDSLTLVVRNLQIEVDSVYNASHMDNERASFDSVVTHGSHMRAATGHGARIGFLGRVGYVMKGVVLFFVAFLSGYLVGKLV